jgi:glycosyltransferase involved in cell wall biosynthesis
VLLQTYPSFEIIVVDDGSTDHTEKVVRDIPDNRIRYMKKENAERAAARNYGTQHAKGSYITFLDSDDILLPHHLQEAADLIAREKDPQWFHLKYRISDAGEGGVMYGNDRDSDRNQMLLSGNYLSCMGVFIRTEVARENLFNENRALSASEDHELWLRLAARYPLKINNSITSVLVNHDARSVVTIDRDKLIARQTLFLELVLNNRDLVPFIGRHRHRVQSNSFSYIALHLVISGKYKTDVMRYTLKAVGHDYTFLTKRRFFAIVKHLIISW